MNTSYAPSAVVAAVLHVGLLFGFGADGSPSSGPEPGPHQLIICSDPLPPLPPLPEPEVKEEEETIATAREDSRPPGPPIPHQPDLLATNVSLDDFIMKPTNPGPATADLLPGGTPDWSSLGGGDGFGRRVQILSLDQLDGTPRSLFQPSPVYPREARAGGREAEVWVEFVVTARGEVTQVRVVRSSSPDFEEATLRAVSRWRFEPGKRDGVPVSFRMAVPVVFRLDAAT
jgi:periplasmic protein TonB